MKFSADYLRRQLTDLPGSACCWVAYSGGVDSHALLHALASLRPGLSCRVAAVHVNHGLQVAASAWDAHCRAVCAALEVSYVALGVDARAAAGESREAAARAARYAALKTWLPRGDCLLTAQHRDDQAETLLLQLLRGGGVKGLAAMPRSASFGGGFLLRPLIDCTHESLVDYALANNLNWVDDPSNRDVSLDRNFLRHETLPALQRRWPALSATLSRSARHCAEAAQMLEDLAREDIDRIAGAAACDTLPVSRVLALSAQRRRNVLRHWITARGASIPSEAVLAHISRDVLESRADAEACVRWDAWELRRYRNRIHLLAQRSYRNHREPLAWHPETALELPGAGGVLSACCGTGIGVRAGALDGASVSVRWRRGGERCRPVGSRHHHGLKKLFQERGVPPWERGLIPLVYVGERLAAVADLWVCDPFGAGASEPGYAIHWRRD